MGERLKHIVGAAGEAASPDLSVAVGPLRFKNPVIAGSCELTMTEEGICACLDAGVGAVVAKSVNEVPAAARQLSNAEYVQVTPDRSILPWAEASVADSLFCRSGLAPQGLDDWLELLARCQAHASGLGATVIGSITVAEAGPAAEIAARLASVVPCVELNLSAPHGRETAPGVISLVGTPEGVARYTSAVRAVTAGGLIVKLTSQSSDVAALARAALDAGADAVTLMGRYGGFLPDIETWEPILGSWGAIGGSWALPLSLYWVSKCFRSLPSGSSLVGTNGARDGFDVVRFLLSGARAVELASLPMLKGASALSRCIEELQAYLLARRLETVEPLIGESARRARTYEEIAATSSNTPRSWSEAAWQGSPAR